MTGSLRVGFTLIFEIRDTCACMQKPCPIICVITAHEEAEILQKCRDVGEARPVADTASILPRMSRHPLEPSPHHKLSVMTSIWQIHILVWTLVSTVTPFSLV